MAVLNINSFQGISPRTPARYLANGQAQVAINCPVFAGSIQPLKDTSASILTLPKTGTPTTLYRFGQDLVSDTQYWFHWSSDVDVCRSQIAGDTSEWTFYTGDGAPKATHAAIGLSGTSLPSASRPLGIPAPTGAPTSGTTGAADVTTDPAVLLISGDDIATFSSTWGIEVRAGYSFTAGYVAVSLTDPIDAAHVASRINAVMGGDFASVTEVAGSVRLESTTKGSNANIGIKFTTDGTTHTTRSAQGGTGDTTPTDSRVYTYTWVSKEAGYEFESAPSPASAIITPNAGQAVQLSGFDSVPAGSYNITNKRIYRSVNGIYLYVGETTAAAATFDDNVAADQLNEELPSLYWSDPPDDLAGLLNMPNGMLAGFSGRDVYFAEPFRPHAWPETYMQSVDYPIVALGRMDTTLAVLTTGVPYLMQGTHPDSIAVVKSDLEQACVSKRSVVSFGSAVVYAAPDGLMMLSSGGSQIITSGLFNYQQWQDYFAPESIHAYHHDNQYIAFYDNGTTQGGFIYDMASKQFILHDIYATAGFRDLQRDKLFLAFADKTLRTWQGGSAKSYVWKSKKFTMPEPMSYSCAQLEAESYPMTMTVMVDGNTLLTKTVTSRDPFRLPAKPVGRDWEIQIEGSGEVFAANLSTSMAELAGV